MNNLYTVRRVYPNGSDYIFTYNAEEASKEIQYSIRYCPGTALFLNNVCIQEGSVSKEMRDGIIAEIEKDMAKAADN